MSAPQDSLPEDLQLADYENYSYEQSRDELVKIVAQLESGQSDLESSLKLWERGEALAKHCEKWLGEARARLLAAQNQNQNQNQTENQSRNQPQEQSQTQTQN